MNDGNTGYPWSTGDILTAADLNAAIGNAASIGAVYGGVVVNAKTYGVVSDYQMLPGTVSWNGTTVTIAGADFNIGPGSNNPYLILPAGGDDGAGNSVPAIVRIVSASGTTATVNIAAAHPFSGLVFTFGGPGLSPNNITITNPGVTDVRVGDVLTVLGGDVIRPGTFYVSQTKVIGATIPAALMITGYIDIDSSGTYPVTTLHVTSTSGTVCIGGGVYGTGVLPGTTIEKWLTGTPGGIGTYSVNLEQIVSPGAMSITYAGSGGAPGPVYLRGTTGHGRRVILLGNVLPGGTLDPASLSVYDPGAYWQNIAALEQPGPTTVEPMSAGSFAQVLPGSWDDNGTTITIGLVHPSVLPYIHLGAAVSAVSDTPDVTGIASPSVVTTIDSTGKIITIDPPAVGAGTGQDVTFTDNYHPVGFTVTFANNATTIVATAALPALVTAGQAISGPGIPGGTYINAIAGDGVTITISNATQDATVKPVTLHSVPFLQGVVVNLNFGVSVASYKDWGSYRSSPAGSPPAFDTTGVHLDGTPLGTTVSLKASGTPTSGQAYVHYGTDNTAAINAWLAAVRTASNARGPRGVEPVGIEAVLPAGCYLTLGSVDATNIAAGRGLNFRFPGVVIHSAIQQADGVPAYNPAGYAWNALGGRWYRMDGQLAIQGNNWFPPDTGFILGMVDTQHAVDNFVLYEIQVVGHFKFAARIFGNVEGTVTINNEGSNSRPPISALRPNFGSVFDGDNHYGKFPWNPAISASSFEGVFEIAAVALHPGGGVPWVFHDVGEMQVQRGYSASWAMPSIFFGGASSPYLNIHCETGTLTDTIFIWHPSNPATGFTGTFIDHSLFASNSLFSWDTEGNYGVPIGSFGGGNALIDIFPQARSTEIFDNTDPLYGGLHWHGDIHVASVLYTASTHYHNKASVRTGRLMFGDTSTSYNMDSLNSTSIVGKSITATGGNIQTQSGNVLASLGFQVTDGQGQMPIYASLSRGTLSLGTVGASGTPGTGTPTVSFHGPGNTSSTPTHKITELTAGTLDIQGNGTNNAYVRIDGTLSVVASLSLPAGSVAVTQAPGDNDTSVATTAFVQAAVASLSTSFVYTATGGNTPASAQDRAGRWPNVKDFGAVLDGVTNDRTAFVNARTRALALRSGTGGSGVVDVPPGNFFISSTTTYSSPGVHWRFSGNAVGTAGASPVLGLNILGDLVENAFNGTKYFGRTDVAGQSASPVLRGDYTGPGTSNGAYQLNATFTTGATNAYGLNVQLTVNGGPSASVVGISSIVNRIAGSSLLFSYYGSCADTTGYRHGGISAIEQDVSTNGPDTVGCAYDPVLGSVVFHTGSNSLAWPAWQGNHAYALNTVIQNTLYTYVCTTAGTSGATSPAFPTSTGTVNDGTAVWTFGTTIATQLARVIDIGRQPGDAASIGAAMYISNACPFFDAILEFSGATMDTATNPNAAAIRLAANHIIDFSGNLTQAGQNLRTLQYNSSTTRWSYKLGAVEYLAVADNGTVITGKGSAGATTDTGGHLLIPFCSGTPTGVPANAARGIALRYDTTNHKLWAYDNGTSAWGNIADSGAFLPLTGGTVTGATTFNAGLTVIGTVPLAANVTNFGRSNSTAWSGAIANWPLLVSTTLTGTPTSGATAAGYIVINNDTADVTGIANATVDGLRIVHQYGGAAKGGGRTGILANLVQLSQTADGAGGNVAIYGIAESRATEGGTGVTPKGQLWGLNTITRLGATSTNFGYMVGYEVDMQAFSGASVANRIGITVNSSGPTDFVQGSAVDTAFQIGQVATNLYPGWRDGFLFAGGDSGQFPIDGTNGTLIRIQPASNTQGLLPAAASKQIKSLAGIDFSPLETSAFMFRFPGGNVGSDGGFYARNARFGGTSTGASIDIPNQVVTAAAVAAGGNYAFVNDRLYDGNGGIYVVTSVSSNVVTGVSVLVPSVAASPPSNPVAVTGLSARGVTLTLTWSAISNTLALQSTAGGKITMPALQASTTYANDAAAATGGVAIGGLYRNGSVVQIRIA